MAMRCCASRSMVTQHAAPVPGVAAACNFWPWRIFAPGRRRMVRPTRRRRVGRTMRRRPGAKILQGQKLQAAATPGTGAACWVTIERDAQHRIAIGGALSGQKLRVYRVHLQLIFKSLIAQTDQAGADPGVLAMDAFDDLLDGLEARLLSDRTLGGSVWQAGEGDRLFGE